MARLGDLGKVITGNTPKTSDLQNYASNDICFVKPSDIVDGTVTYLDDSEFYISEHARTKARVLPPKSVLATCIGIIGKIAINNVECAFNQQINAIIPDNSKCLTEYLAYALQNKQAEMQDIANAPVVPILNKSQFSDIEIKLPSLAEQKKIVEKLNAVAELIALRKEQLVKLDQLVKSRFIELFGDPLLDDGRYPKVPLGTLAEVGSSKRIFEKEYVSEGVPFYRTKEIVELSKGNRITTELFITRDRYDEIRDGYGVPQKGDLLISAVGTIGVIWIVDGKNDFYFKDGNLLRVAATERFAPTYIKHLLEALIGAYKQEMSSGTAYAALTISALKDMLVYEVPITEQEQFAAFVEQTDKSKLAIQQSLDKLELLKKSLMQEYFG